MTDNRETIAMLRTLKAQAVESHNDTAVLEVKIDSFNFVIDEAIKALEQEPCEYAVSLDGVIDTIEWYRTNPQHFTEDNLIEDIKGLPPVAPKEKSEYEHDREVVKAYHDGQAYILDKIETELLANAEMHPDGDYYLRDKWVSEIIDKYRREG